MPENIRLKAAVNSTAPEAVLARPMALEHYLKAIDDLFTLQ
jgi:hypothetical protein